MLPPKAFLCLERRNVHADFTCVRNQSLLHSEHKETSRLGTAHLYSCTVFIESTKVLHTCRQLLGRCGLRSASCFYCACTVHRTRIVQVLMEIQYFVRWNLWRRISSEFHPSTSFNLHFYTIFPRHKWWFVKFGSLHYRSLRKSLAIHALCMFSLQGFAYHCYLLLSSSNRAAYRLPSKLRSPYKNFPSHYNSYVAVEMSRTFCFPHPLRRRSAILPFIMWFSRLLFPGSLYKVSKCTILPYL